MKIGILTAPQLFGFKEQTSLVFCVLSTGMLHIKLVKLPSHWQVTSEPPAQPQADDTYAAIDDSEESEEGTFDNIYDDILCM